jgi:alkylation response protein AidB-like acyl-CoA dehydrogenase
MTASKSGTERPATGDDDAAFRAVLSGVGAPAATRSDAEMIRAGRSYLSALAEDGWFVPTWPLGAGGRGADKREAARVRAVVRTHSAPDLYPFFVGLHMIGPTLLQHGDAAQQNRWLRRIADGSDIWCQMFSEPGAGSDLANVSTRAVRTATGWTLDGQKVWTSRGSYADFGLCLTRTDPDVPKHAGLTMFVVPMKQAGVTVRPLHQMNGDDHFSEVFLDGVEILDDHRIGEVGAGWSIALAVLAFERSSIAVATSGRSPQPRQNRRRVPEWLQTAADAGQLEDPVRRNMAIKVFVAAEVARLTSGRAAARAKSTGAPGAEGSGQKLRLASTAKERSYLLKDLQGADGMLTVHRGHDAAMTAPSLSLRGGTDEIQRNIIAERVLGLPAEPRADRDQPWAPSRRGAA